MQKESTNGAIHVADVIGTVKAVTSNGAIRVVDCAGVSAP
ncbi:hypothetical protein Poly41_56530 [Novipirellula artificiosorum]|uniref:Uncharacterized protein n=1 Tax=Novipirellula artificiosorum TaxID=2528016 RepID=A0A5C6D5S0_9BACT|nr:hypothetical protein Poly41_56530 [Novipirellula artificiosorum]